MELAPRTLRRQKEPSSCPFLSSFSRSNTFTLHRIIIISTSLFLLPVCGAAKCNRTYVYLIYNIYTYRVYNIYIYIYKYIYILQIYTVYICIYIYVNFNFIVNLFSLYLQYIYIYILYILWCI